MYVQSYDSIGSISFNLGGYIEVESVSDIVLQMLKLSSVETDENGCPKVTRVLCSVELNNLQVDIEGYGVGWVSGCLCSSNSATCNSLLFI